MVEQLRARVAGRLTGTDAVDEIVNPYSGERVAVVARCGPAEVDAACRGALAALRRDDFPQHARAEVLDRAAVLLGERAGEFARTITAEAGKPVRDARAEVGRARDTFRFAAAEARTLSGEMLALGAAPTGDGKLGFALRVPVGVVAAISPFNFPLNLVAHKLAPAIAAGCPVVLKPADRTPLSAIHLVDLLVEAGLPEDWISVVTGGAEAGQALVAHPIPRLVSFTGSAPVGRAIQAAAAGKRVALELGGTAPLIVEPDADLDRVAAKVRAAGFGYAGQSCISTQRVLVHESVKDALVERLTAAVATLAAGDPADEATEVGPLLTKEATARVGAWIADAVDAGATLATGGTVADDGVLRPAVVVDPPAGCDLYREEVFGPVVTVTGYRDFDHAVELANDSRYGLHAGIFTSDVATALGAIRRLDFGGVLVNEAPTWRADQQPYGGVKDSGNTREGPAYAVREMTELRVAVLSA